MGSRNFLKKLWSQPGLGTPDLGFLALPSYNSGCNTDCESAAGIRQFKVLDLFRGREHIFFAWVDERDLMEMMMLKWTLKNGWRYGPGQNGGRVGV